MSAWRREAHLFMRAPATRVLLALLLLLSAIGAVNGVRHVQGQRAALSAALAEDRDSFERKRARLLAIEQGELEEGQFGSPRKAHQAIMGAARPLAAPPAALAALSSTSRPTPDWLPVSMRTRHVDQPPSLQDPTNLLDGAFDLTFVATWLLPLFAVVLGCDVLAGDRERGLATLLASQGDSLAAITRVRLLVRFTALFGVVGAVSAIAVALTEASRLLDIAPALVLWLGALALWIAFWLALAGAVNAWVRTTAAAALTLLCAWIAVAILIPAGAGALVNVLAPPPNRLDGVLALRAIDADLNRRRQEVTAAYYAASPDNRPRVQGDEYEHYFVTELYPRQLAFDAAYAPIAARMEAARVKQAQLMRRAAPFTPALAFRLIMDDLAGFAPERRTAFLASVDAYQARWRAHFDHKLASMTLLSVDDYDRMPEFEPSSEPARERWTRLVLLLAALTLPTLAALAWAARALHRARPSGGAAHAYR